MLSKRSVIFSAVAICCASLGLSPVSAEVAETRDNGFVIALDAETSADVRTTWLKLIMPSQWWESSHTWSGNAANLRMSAQGGGCFCEVIPGKDDESRPPLQGGAEHMRVIQAVPDAVLRMRGALGPLQGEAVDGVMTITLASSDRGTKLHLEYVVGGYMRYSIPDISASVDKVLRTQLARLTEALGETVVSDAPEVESTAPQQGAGEAMGDGEAEGVNAADITSPPSQ